MDHACLVVQVHTVLVAVVLQYITRKRIYVPSQAKCEYETILKSVHSLSHMALLLLHYITRSSHLLGHKDRVVPSSCLVGKVLVAPYQVVVPLTQGVPSVDHIPLEVDSSSTGYCYLVQFCLEMMTAYFLIDLSDPRIDPVYLVVPARKAKSN